MSEILIDLYLAGKKGYSALRYLVEKEGVRKIGKVVSARDAGVEKDFYDEIKYLCSQRNIFFIDRKNNISDQEEDKTYKICIGWRWLLESNENLVVIHDSLLPKYRGFSPLANMLINGEPEIGVTAILAEESYDEGPVILAKRMPIQYPIKIDKAIDLISLLYQELIVDIFCLVSGGKLEATPQNHDSASYSLWRDEEDYLIDWRKSAEWIARFCDSVGYPYRGAKSKVNGVEVRIIESKPVDDVFVEAREDNLGKIIFKRDGCPIVVCGTGLLKIIEIRADGKEEQEKIEISFRSRFTGKT